LEALAFVSWNENAPGPGTAVQSRLKSAGFGWPMPLASEMPTAERDDGIGAGPETSH